MLIQQSYVSRSSAIVIATVDRTIATVLMEAGMDKELCSAGEDGVIAIQGALVWLRVEQSCSRR